MFRDRVVSLEQTFELGEKYLETLKDVLAEALPGFEIREHELEHERDLFVVRLEDSAGVSRRILFTRMVLSDSSCVPAITEDRDAPARGRIVEHLRRSAAGTEVLLAFRDVMGETDRSYGDEIDAEWRAKQAVLAAQRHAEEVRRTEEKRRQRQQNEARQRARREASRSRGERTAGAPAAAKPGSPVAEGVGGRVGGGGEGGRRHRRGRGGRGGEAPGSEGRPRPQPGPRPPRPPTPQPVAPTAAPASDQKPRPEGGQAPRGGGGGSRRRRRGRGGRGGDRGNRGGENRPPG